MEAEIRSAPYSIDSYPLSSLLPLALDYFDYEMFKPLTWLAGNPVLRRLLAD